MRVREAIDKAGQASDAVVPDDARFIREYAEILADHAGVPRNSKATEQIAAGLTLLYRAGVVAGRSRA